MAPLTTSAIFALHQTLNPATAEKYEFNMMFSSGKRKNVINNVTIIGNPLNKSIYNFAKFLNRTFFVVRTKPTIVPTAIDIIKQPKLSNNVLVRPSSKNGKLSKSICKSIHPFFTLVMSIII